MYTPTKHIYSSIVLLALICFAFPVSGQQKNTLTGIVKGSDGSPLWGAGVMLIPGNQSAISGSDGFFQLSDVPAGKYKLRIRYVGFAEAVENVTLPVKDNKALVFLLKENENELSEVTVVGRNHKINR